MSASTTRNAIAPAKVDMPFRRKDPSTSLVRPRVSLLSPATPSRDPLPV